METTGLNFGRYQVLSELGHGSMGTVYKARDPKIDRFVAIKTVSVRGQTPAEETQFRKRFAQEAQAAGRLSHPHIVTVFDVGETPDTEIPFIVMEYVSGQSLDDLLHSTAGRLPVESVLQYCLDIAEALHYAHSEGIVHRDIKPANILITSDSQAKIADFGIAKINSDLMTNPGSSIGTPAYASPEQLSGDKIDGRSDLFSLGVILYSLLTGHRPFQGNSALTVSFKVVNQEPISVCALTPQLPEQLDRIVARALAKQPADRYQSGMEMARDLRAVRTGLLGGSIVNAPFPETTKQITKEEVLAATASRGTSRPAIHPAFSQFGMQVIVGAMVLVSLVGWRLHSHWSDRASSAKSEAAALTQVRTDAAAQTQPTAAASSPAPEDQVPVSEQTLPVASEPSNKKHHQQPHLLPKAAKPSVVAAAPSDIQPVSAPEVVKSSTMHIHLRHEFDEVKLLIWVDDVLSFSSSSEGEVKSRLIIFKSTEGHGSSGVQLTAGDHQIRVRVQSGGDAYDQSATISGTFPNRGERELNIDCRKKKDIQLTLK
jgi:serine/threonine protein kinase